MANKVEAIAAQIVGMAIEDSAHAQVKALVDALIAAARAEGVAAERERIRAGGEQFSEGDFVEDSDYIGIGYGVRSDNAVANDDIYVVPASLLAPDKESEK